MKILLSNDDGYHAEGLTTLALALSDLAELVIVAPDRNQSGASHSLTLDMPLRVEKTREGIHYVSGTLPIVSTWQLPDCWKQATLTW